MIDRKYVLVIACSEWVCGWTVSALLLISLVPVAHGQTNTGSQTPTSETPTASSNVDEVSLDLIVHDKRHKQILDLKPEDIAVNDNGVPVTLKGLHLVTGESNFDHAITMVFDRFNGTTAKNAQGVAEKILKALPSKGYSFAVMDFSGRLRLMQSFTEDRDTVRQAVKVETDSSAVNKAPVVQLTFTNLAVNRAPEIRDPRTARAEQAEKTLIAIVRTGADSSGKHVDVLARARCQMLLSALEGAQQIHQDQHTPPQLAGLLFIVRSQQKLDSRKALVYFTQNMQMDSASKRMLNTIAGTANQAVVSIYVVDMDALDVGGKYQVDSAIGAQNIAFNPTPQVVAGGGGRATQAPTQQTGPAGPTTNAGIAVDRLRQSDQHPFTEIKSPMAEFAPSTGSGRWKHRDTIAELLRYRDKNETHTMLELNGKGSTVDRSAMGNKNGAFSAGELGGVLSSVFSPKSKADFQWMETDALGTGTVQVFSYRVAQGNSSFSVVGMNDRQVTVAFHGIVFIDSASRNVRRISMIADDLPRDFPTQRTSINVNTAMWRSTPTIT